MLFYHGTTERVSKAIQREGLRPHRETAYKMSDDYTEDFRKLPGEQAQTIYITENRRWANAFARFRADYEMADNGEAIIFGEGASFYKKGNSCECKEKPVVIVFDVPENIARKFEYDIQAYEGLVCECILGPEYIKEIVPAEEYTPPSLDEQIRSALGRY